MVQTIANFDHFKDQNTHFAHWSTVNMISGDVFIGQPRQKVDRNWLKYFLDVKVGFSLMDEALTVPIIANFDHFKDQNTRFAHWSTVIMIFGDVFIGQPRQKVVRDLLKYFKVGFSWMGEALTVPTIANFDHFKGQNTHIAHWITVFVISGDVFIA